MSVMVESGFLISWASPAVMDPSSASRSTDRASRSAARARSTASAIRLLDAACAIHSTVTPAKRAPTANAMA